VTRRDFGNEFSVCCPFRVSAWTDAVQNRPNHFSRNQCHRRDQFSRWERDEMSAGLDDIVIESGLLGRHHPAPFY